MAKLIAIDWDDQELRALVTETQGTSLRLLQVASRPLPDFQTPEAQTAALQPLVKELLEAHHVRSTTLVALGRGSAELRRMVLPPAPSEELPDLVRFQSLREFNELAEDWPLDFQVLSESSVQQQQVLAAAIAPETVAQVRAICDAAEVSLDHLTVRACGLSSLATGALETPEALELLVVAGASELELVCMAGDQIVFLRSAKVAHEEGSTSLASVMWELRRTMVAVQTQLAPQKVQRITICGDSPLLTGLAAAVAEQGTLDCRTVDPFAQFTLAPGVTLPDSTSPLAPLAGLLVAAAAGQPPSIDFLHPRQRPVVEDRRKQYALWGGGIVLALGLLIALFIGYRLHSLDQRIAELRADQQRQQAALERAKEVLAQTEALKSWQGASVNWLEQLARLAECLPSNKELLLTSLTADLKGGSPRWQLNGQVAQSSDMTAVESAVREAQQEPTLAPGKKIDPKERRKGSERYPWEFSLSSRLLLDPPPRTEKGS